MNQIDNDIILFAGSRIITPLFKQHYENNLHKINQIYRGLPYPKHLLSKGLLIEEWHGSTHWTIDKDIAIKFSSDYINEEYEEIIYKELGLDPYSNEEVFIKLVLCVKNISGYELYKDLEKLRNELAQEKEVTIIGKNYVILDIQKISDIYFAEVMPEEEYYLIDRNENT